MKYACRQCGKLVKKKDVIVVEQARWYRDGNYCPKCFEKERKKKAELYDD